MPAARAAAVAAAAFSRLCAPGMSGSAGSSSSAANSTRRAAPGTRPSRGHDPDVLPGLVLEDPQLRGAVASKSPCRSRWSGSRLSSTAIRGRKRSTSSSWKLESSQTIQSPPVRGQRARSARCRGCRRFGAPSIEPSSSVVVVFPFVPVTPRIGFGNSRDASSISLQTGTRFARRSDERRLARDARALHEHVDAVEQGEVRVVTERPVGGDDLRPPASSAACAARPERASPRTSTRFSQPELE